MKLDWKFKLSFSDECYGSMDICLLSLYQKFEVVKKWKKYIHTHGDYRHTENFHLFIVFHHSCGRSFTQLSFVYIKYFPSWPLSLYFFIFLWTKTKKLAFFYCCVFYSVFRITKYCEWFRIDFWKIYVILIACFFIESTAIK